MFLMILKCQFIVLLTINILYKINCEECICGTEAETSTCDEAACGGTCRFFHDDNSYLQCGNEIQETSYYYKDNSGNCQFSGSKSGNQKIIGDTREVVNDGNCLNDYKSLGIIAILKNFYLKITLQ